MKCKIVMAIGLLSMGANAATTLSGTAMTRPYTDAGTTQITNGSLAMLIVDTGDNGFIGLGTLAGGTLLTTTADPGLAIADMSTTVGNLFGGDTIAAVYASGGTGISGALTLPAGSAFFGKQFAMVFFDTSSITGISKYGIVRGSDWTFPVSDTGAGITFSSTDANGTASFFQFQSATPTAGQTQNGFYTAASARPSTIFAVVPEPSAALLGALGTLGLLRRRRN